MIRRRKYYFYYTIHFLMLTWHPYIRPTLRVGVFKQWIFCRNLIVLILQIIRIIKQNSNCNVILLYGSIYLMLQLAVVSSYTSLVKILGIQKAIHLTDRRVVWVWKKSSILYQIFFCFYLNTESKVMREIFCRLPILILGSDYFFQFDTLFLDQYEHLFFYLENLLTSV